MPHDPYSLVKQENKQTKKEQKQQGKCFKEKWYVKQSGDSSSKRECGWGSSNNKVSSCLEEEDFTLLLEKATVGKYQVERQGKQHNVWGNCSLKKTQKLTKPYCIFSGKFNLPLVFVKWHAFLFCFWNQICAFFAYTSFACTILCMYNICIHVYNLELL